MTKDTPQSMLEEFVQAFSGLDLEGMLQCFDEEATAFFPVEHQLRLLEGKAAIKQAFAGVIGRVRDSGAMTLQLEVVDLVMQVLDETCVASFHLTGERFGRRTVVLRRQEDEWLICHLHASNAPRRA